jgi:hypothetical protein
MNNEIDQLGLPFWRFADFGGGLHTVFAKLKSLEITPIVIADHLGQTDRIANL